MTEVNIAVGRTINRDRYQRPYIYNLYCPSVAYAKHGIADTCIQLYSYNYSNKLSTRPVISAKYRRKTYIRMKKKEGDVEDRKCSKINQSYLLSSHVGLWVILERIFFAFHPVLKLSLYHMSGYFSDDLIFAF